MEARHGFEHSAPTIGGREPQAPAVEEFVRFCYHRRRVGWPELYDEMCAVAARGVFRGWGFAELADQGICFTLADLPALAAGAAEISRDERERARRLRADAKAVEGRVASDADRSAREAAPDGSARALSAALASAAAD